MPNFLDFYEARQLNLGATVVCPKIQEDMHYGWSDDMNDMVGVPLVVMDKSVHEDEELVGITLMHPADGAVYTFDHWALQVLNTNAGNGIAVPAENLNEAASFDMDGNTYSAKTRLHGDIFGKKGLKEDVKSFRDHVLQDKYSLPLSRDMFVSMKEHCPRLIGVALSNNIISKERIKNA